MSALHFLMDAMASSDGSDIASSRSLEQYRLPDPPAGDGHRRLREDREELESRLPAAARLVGVAADYADMAAGTWAGSAMAVRTAQLEAATVPSSRYDRVRVEAAARVAATPPPGLEDRRWYDLDDRLWPVFDDRRVGGEDIPSGLTCWLMVRRMLDSPAALRLYLPGLPWWLELHRLQSGCSPGFDECQRELRRLHATATADHWYGCWLMTACRDYRRGSHRDHPDLPESLCRFLGGHHGRLMNAAAFLDRLGGDAPPSVQVGVTRAGPGRSKGAGPGRPVSVEGSRRDRLIQVAFASGRFEDFEAAADALGQEYPFHHFSWDIVRNAVEGRRAGIRDEVGQE